eukprot:COSAG06_NODE_23876_length_679_cov_0.813793_1_plen_151_part_00
MPSPHAHATHHFHTRCKRETRRTCRSIRPGYLPDSNPVAHTARCCRCTWWSCTWKAGKCNLYAHRSQSGQVDRLHNGLPSRKTSWDCTGHTDMQPDYDSGLRLVGSSSTQSLRQTAYQMRNLHSVLGQQKAAGLFRMSGTLDPRPGAELG